MGYVRANKAAASVGWLLPVLLLLSILSAAGYPRPQVTGAKAKIQNQTRPAITWPLFDSQAINWPLARSGQAGTGAARSPASRAPLVEAGGSSRSTIWSGVFEPATLFSFAGSPLPVASTERGIAVRAYVPGTLDLAVQQQPEGDAYYVSGAPDVLTQFRKAAGNGVTGLLAHNHQAGENFYRLKIGQKVWVAYSDGHYAAYTVAGIRRYQRIDTSDLFSDFLDLESGQVLTSTEVFNRYYKNDGGLIFQTCLKRGGNWSWGLYFVTAAPDR